MNRSLEQALAALILFIGFAWVPAGAAQVTILTPAHQDTIHDNSGNMTVEVEVEPPIDPDSGASIRILLDGKRAAPDSPGTSFSLRGVERGEHWLQALLIDRQGRTLTVSDTVRFTMWQASVNAPPRKKQQ